MIYKQNERLDKYTFDACANCGEQGHTWWEGPNPRPNTANRGVLISTCGTLWRCGKIDCLDRGCGITQVYCYRCGTYSRLDPNYPATWEPAYFSWQ